MDTMERFYPYCALGEWQFDPRRGHKQYDPWWALLIVEEDIIDLYRWFLKKHGTNTEPNKLWGPHVSVIKGSEPLNKDRWGDTFPAVKFWYTNVIYGNEKHAWLNVYSPEASKIREELGLPPKCFFHMTLGLLK